MLLRWAAVGGAIYYYTTSNVFTDEPECIQPPPVPQ